jgi:hypothetical protein
VKTDIFDDILEYVPEEHREAYWRMVAHFRQLKPDDEILNIIFAMGVLTFVLRELPAGIIEERNAWQNQFGAFRKKADEIMEASNRHMVAAANQCEIVSRTLEQSGAQFCESAGRIEVASREAVERIDVDGMAQRLTARVEKRVITRFDDLATTMERRYQLMEKIGEQTKTVIHDLREIHMGRTITVVSALILMACVIGGVSVYSRVRAADYAAFAEQIAEIARTAQSNQEAFAALAANHIHVDVIDVTDDSGAKLYEKVLRLSPALDVRSDAPNGQPKTGDIYFSVTPTLQEQFERNQAEVERLLRESSISQ